MLDCLKLKLIYLNFTVERFGDNFNKHREFRNQAGSEKVEGRRSDRTPGFFSALVLDKSS